MNTLIRIASPEDITAPVGFDTPLDMLRACHRRVEQQFSTLRRLSSHLAMSGSDKQAQEAATAVMRYFDIAAPKHHADEEEDLFPALMESMAGSDAVCLRELTHQLLSQHVELDGYWQRFRSVLVEVAAGRPAQLAPALVQAFDALYSEHILREEAELLPMAERLLSDREIQRIGQAMRLRRGAAV